jgi:uncharacterized membrane protein YdjX (TVP38/TMEM64 family)
MHPSFRKFYRFMRFGLHKSLTFSKLRTDATGESRMMMILAGVAFGLFFMVIPTWEFVKQQRILNDQKAQGHNYAVFSDAKWMIIIQAALVVFSILIAAVTGVSAYTESGDGTWLGIGIALAGSASGSIISALTNRRLFYTDKGFLLKDHFVAYRSIKNFSRRKSLLGVANVETLRGESLTLTNGCAAKLQALAQEAKA